MNTKELQSVFQKFVGIDFKLSRQGLAINLSEIQKELNDTIMQMAQALDEIAAEPAPQPAKLSIQAEVWLKAWRTTAPPNSSNPASWADHCMSEFLKRFPEYETEKQP